MKGERQCFVLLSVVVFFKAFDETAAKNKDGNHNVIFFSLQHNVDGSAPNDSLKLVLLNDDANDPSSIGDKVATFRIPHKRLKPQQGNEYRSQVSEKEVRTIKQNKSRKNTDQKSPSLRPDIELLSRLRSHPDVSEKLDTEFRSKETLQEYRRISHPTTQQFSYQDPLKGTYVFGYRTKDQYRYEERRFDGLTFGRFGWQDQNDIWHNTKFISDQNGYRIISPFDEANGLPTTEMYWSTTPLIQFSTYNQSGYHEAPFQKNQGNSVHNNHIQFNADSPSQNSFGSLLKQPQKFSDLHSLLFNSGSFYSSELPNKRPVIVPSDVTVAMGWPPIVYPRPLQSVSAETGQHHFQKQEITEANLQDNFFSGLPLNLLPSTSAHTSPFPNTLTRIWPDLKRPSDSTNLTKIKLPIRQNPLFLNVNKNREQSIMHGGNLLNHVSLPSNQGSNSPYGMQEALTTSGHLQIPWIGTQSAALVSLPSYNKPQYIFPYNDYQHNIQHATHVVDNPQPQLQPWEFSNQAHSSLSTVLPKIPPNAADDNTDYLLLSDEFEETNGSITNDPAFGTITEIQMEKYGGSNVTEAETPNIFIDLLNSNLFTKEQSSKPSATLPSEKTAATNQTIIKDRHTQSSKTKVELNSQSQRPDQSIKQFFGMHNNPMDSLQSTEIISNKAEDPIVSLLDSITVRGKHPSTVRPQQLPNPLLFLNKILQNLLMPNGRHRIVDPSGRVIYPSDLT